MPSTRQFLHTALLALALASEAASEQYELVMPPTPEAKAVAEARELLDGWELDRATLAKAYPLLQAELDRNPDNYEAMLQLARLSVMTGQPGGNQQALQLLEQALEANPDFSEAYVLRAHVLTNLDRDSEAHEALRQAYRMGSSSPWYTLNSAALSLKARMYKDAAFRCSGVIRTRDTNIKVMLSAYECRAQHLYQQRDWAALEQDHKAKLALAPGYATVNAGYAWFLCIDRGRCEEATTFVDKSMEIRPNQTALYVETAILYDAWARAVDKYGASSPEAELRFKYAAQRLPDLDLALATFGAMPGNERLVTALLAKGADIAAQNHNGYTALMATAERGDPVAAAVLIKHGADVNQFPKSVSSLMLAARDGHLDMVEFLIRAGADERSRPTEAGWWAARHSFPDVAAVLEARFPQPEG